jgi:hypothetical protein
MLSFLPWRADGLVELYGNRYVLSGKVLPGLRKWFEGDTPTHGSAFCESDQILHCCSWFHLRSRCADNAGLDINFTSPSQTAEQAEAKGGSARSIESLPNR